MKRRISFILFALLIVVMTVSTTLVFAFSQEISVTNTGIISYTALPLIYTYDNTGLSDGLDTRVFNASDVAKPHMPSDNKVLFVDDVTASDDAVYTYEDGQSSLTSFPIIIGRGGQVVTVDAAALELGDGFTITINDTYFDTGVGANKNILYKQDAFRIYVSAAGYIRAAILSAGDVEEVVVTKAVASGVHDLVVSADGDNLSIAVDGGAATTAALGSDSVPDNANNYYWNQNSVCPYIGSIVLGILGEGSLETPEIYDNRDDAGDNASLWNTGTRQLAIESDGDLWVCSYGDDADNAYAFFISRSTDDGETWTKSLSITLSWLASRGITATDVIAASIAVDSADRVYVPILYENTDSYRYLTMITYYGGTWSSLATSIQSGIASTKFSDGAMIDVAIGNANEAFVVVDIRQTGGDYDFVPVVERYTTALGYNGEYQVSSDLSDHLTNPEMVVDSANNFHVVWMDIDDAVPNNDDYSLVYSKYDGSWTDTELASGLRTNTEGLFNPSIAINGDEDLLVTWTEYYYGAPATYHVYSREYISSWGVETTVVDPSAEYGGELPTYGTVAYNQDGDGLFAYNVRVGASQPYTYPVYYKVENGGTWGDDEEIYAPTNVDTDEPSLLNAYHPVIGGIHTNIIPTDDIIIGTFPDGTDSPSGYFEIQRFIHIGAGATTNVVQYQPNNIIVEDSVSGTVDSGATTTIVDSVLTEADDYWNYAKVTITDTTDDYAPKGQVRYVTDFVQGTNTLTTTAFSVAPEAGDTYTVEFGILPDRLTSDGVQNATIGWGSNIAGVISVTSSDYIPQPTITPVSPVGGTGALIPDNWYGDGSQADRLPFYETFNEKAQELGVTTQTLYLFFMLAVASAVGFGILLFTGSTILCVTGMIFTVAAGVSTTILSGWMVFLLILFAATFYYLSRQH